jgi:hypothetical protein
MTHYKIRIKSPIKGAFMAHIHLAEAGKNGPIAVWLYGGPPPNPANAKVPGGEIRAQIVGDVDDD